MEGKLAVTFKTEPRPNNQKMKWTPLSSTGRAASPGGPKRQLFDRLKKRRCGSSRRDTIKSQTSTSEQGEQRGRGLAKIF